MYFLEWYSHLNNSQMPCSYCLCLAKFGIICHITTKPLQEELQSSTCIPLSISHLTISWLQQRFHTQCWQESHPSSMTGNSCWWNENCEPQKPAAGIDKGHWRGSWKETLSETHQAPWAKTKSKLHSMLKMMIDKDPAQIQTSCEMPDNIHILNQNSPKFLNPTHSFQSLHNGCKNSKFSKTKHSSTQHLKIPCNQTFNLTIIDTHIPQFQSSCWQLIPLSSPQSPVATCPQKTKHPSFWTPATPLLPPKHPAHSENQHGKIGVAQGLGRSIKAYLLEWVLLRLSCPRPHLSASTFLFSLPVGGSSYPPYSQERARKAAKQARTHSSQEATKGQFQQRFLCSTAAQYHPSTDSLIQMGFKMITVLYCESSTLFGVPYVGLVLVTKGLGEV